MQYIYIIGAQCTGKTTLVEAVSAWLKHNKPDISSSTIQETARTTLQQHNYTRDDIRPGGDRCQQLQKLILQRQIEIEGSCQGSNDLIISDRSGVDPLVYAQIYCGEDTVRDMMLENEGWMALQSSMRTGTVIICEPVEEWLFDDGVRLMPENVAEWFAMHVVFCEMLQRHRIPYAVLPATTVQLHERVEFVLGRAGVVDSLGGLCRNAVTSPFKNERVAQA